MYSEAVFADSFCFLFPFRTKSKENRIISSWASSGNEARNARRSHSLNVRWAVPKAAVRNGISVTANWRRNPRTQAAIISLLSKCFILNIDFLTSLIPTA